MPDNSAPNPGWKNQGPSPAKKETSPGWKQDGAAPSPGVRPWQAQRGSAAAPSRPRSRIKKLFIAAGLLGALMAGIVIVVLMLKPPQPACLVVLGSSYDVNLAVPHNAYGWQGLIDLKAAADDSNPVAAFFSPPRKTRLAFPPNDEVRDRASWDKLWAGASQPVAEKTVVLFLALHGGADDKGAFLILNDERGHDKVYVKEILEELPKKWKDKNVLVILEPAQVDAHWPSGMLRNNFVRKLYELEKDIERQPNLLVMCASDKDEISWPSEEWRHTIFTHYVIEGLKGAAAPGGTGNITVQHLWDYVRDEVRAWAQAQRRAQQTPILLGARDKARKIDLTVITEPYTATRAAQAPGRNFVQANELENAWAACALLGKREPSPAVYTPHLWRVYRDTLLRWEQLARAGHPPGKLEVLKTNLKTYEKDIIRNSAVDLGAREITRALPLQTALGLASPWPNALGKRKELLDEFNRLWQEKVKENRQTLLENLGAVAQITEGDRLVKSKLLFGELCRHVLHLVKDSKTLTHEDLVSARDLVLDAENQFNQSLARPAEAHLLVMLKHLDSKTPPPIADLRLALHVRVLAEEAALAAPASSESHPYSEVVYPWVKQTVQKADAARRLGEDWLFGASDKEWTQARTQLTEAKGQYEKALDAAALLRTALDLRDSALADLPYYAQWLAQRRHSPSNVKEVAELTVHVERLAAKLGDLAWFLEQTDFQGDAFYSPPAKNSPRNPDRQSPETLLKRWNQEVDKDFQQANGLQDKFHKICQKFSTANLETEWRDLQAALAVPLFEDADKRKTLLIKGRSHSKKLHDEKSDRNTDPKKDAPVDDKDLREDIAEKTLRHKRLALAALAPHWQEHHVLKAPADPAPEKVGVEIGKYCQGLPEEIRKPLEASLKSPSLEKAAANLPEADLQYRQLHGGIKPAWHKELYSPAEALRRLRCFDLLLWQAKRAVEDHWYAGPEEPYYLPAAQAYVQMANDLAEVGADKDFNRQRQKVAIAYGESIVKAGLHLTDTTNKNWTSEKEFPLTWQLSADPGVPVPGGIPMHWLKVDGPLAEVQEKGFDQRQPLVPWLPPTINKTLQDLPSKGVDDKKQRDVKATLTCFYRGQLKDSSIAPKTWDPDLIVNQFPPPNKAGIAIRLDKKFTYGAISIVLDCSGSMVEPKNNIAGQTRYDHAVKALGSLLKTIPDGTYVSFFAFVWKKNAGEADTTFEEIHHVAPWSKANDFDGLMAKVKNLEPRGNSPIAHALVDSLNSGFPHPTKQYKGPKLVLALTDGDDNYSWFYNQKDWPKVLINEKDGPTQKRYNDHVNEFLLKKFVGKCQLHVVCFNSDAKGAEMKNAKEQFREAAVATKGSFVSHDKDEGLAATLENAIRPKVELQKGTDTLVPEYDVSYAGGELQWKSVQPGDLTVVLKGIYTQHVRLNQGDFMMLTLNREQGAVRVERRLYAKELDENLKEPKVQQWQATVVRNHENRARDGISQFITLEETTTKDKEGVALQQIRPGFVWLEAKPSNSPTPLGLVTWRPEYFYPAHAWSLQAKGWPSAGSKLVPADVNLWWDANKYPANPLCALTLNRKNIVTQKPITLGKTKFTLEHFGLEKHEVTVTSVNKPEKREERECLVVRLEHETNKPMYVQLLSPGKKAAAFQEQHRYYASANKYTALFWDLPDLELAEYSLHVTSLEDFKASREPIVSPAQSVTPFRAAPYPVQLKDDE